VEIGQLVVTLSKALKGELGELQFYFRKIPLHQQKSFDGFGSF